MRSKDGWEKKKEINLNYPKKKKKKKRGERDKWKKWEKEKELCVLEKKKTYIETSVYLFSILTINHENRA